MTAEVTAASLAVSETAALDSAQRLLDHIRLLRADAEYGYREWEHNMTLSNAIRRDDARERLDNIAYAEPAAQWVVTTLKLEEAK